MPIELGFDKCRTQKGLPYPADERYTNEIFETLFEALKPKFMELKATFNPRGNVFTTITINSNQAGLSSYEIKE